MKRRRLDDELDRAEAAAGVGVPPELTWSVPRGPEAVMEVLAGRTWCSRGHGWHDGKQCPICLKPFTFDSLWQRDVQ